MQQRLDLPRKRTVSRVPLSCLSRNQSRQERSVSDQIRSTNGVAPKRKMRGV